MSKNIDIVSCALKMGVTHVFVGAHLSKINSS